MPLELREVKEDAEWNELIQCESESYETPFNGVYVLFRPDRGGTPQGREGFKELRDRQLAWHKQESASRWFKVVDTDIGDKVVGGAEWKMYPENPYTDPVEHPVDATWWPKGESREFANKLMDDWLCPRWHTMNRPHVLLSILYVHPEHRRRGVGSMLIRWGYDRADELGIETIVEATAEGKPTYAANGFRYQKTFLLDAVKDDPSPRWMELEKMLQTPIPLFLMVRPKGGGYGKHERKGT